MDVSPRQGHFVVANIVKQNPVHLTPTPCAAIQPDRTPFSSHWTGRGSFCFRAEFEDLCADLLRRVEVPMRKILEDTSKCGGRAVLLCLDRGFGKVRQKLFRLHKISL